jgi:hypothetical protein
LGQLPLRLPKQRLESPVLGVQANQHLLRSGHPLKSLDQFSDLRGEPLHLVPQLGDPFPQLTLLGLVHLKPPLPQLVFTA